MEAKQVYFMSYGLKTLHTESTVTLYRSTFGVTCERHTLMNKEQQECNSWISKRRQVLRTVREHNITSNYKRSFCNDTAVVPVTRTVSTLR